MDDNDIEEFEEKLKYTKIGKGVGLVVGFVTIALGLVLTSAALLALTVKLMRWAF